MKWRGWTWFLWWVVDIKSDIDYLVGQLHGGNDIQHIGRFADLLSFQKIEMVEAGAAHQYFQSGFFIFLEILQHFRAVDRQLDTVVHEYQPPQLGTHFL